MRKCSIIDDDLKYYLIWTDIEATISHYMNVITDNTIKKREIADHDIITTINYLGINSDLSDAYHIYVNNFYDFTKIINLSCNVTVYDDQRNTFKMKTLRAFSVHSDGSPKLEILFPESQTIYVHLLSKGDK